MYKRKTKQKEKNSNKYIPQILIIHLKRFNNKHKLEIKVDFPIRGLDLSKYVLENKDNYDMTYDLFPVAYHIGKVGYSIIMLFVIILLLKNGINLKIVLVKLN